MGSTILLDYNVRDQLPFKKPDEPPNLWKILKKFIGQDITKVSLPVILNEPLSAAQSNVENLLLVSELIE